MADFFIREDLRRDQLTAADSASQLLHWAGKLAAGAAEDDVYRDKEGRKTLRIHHAGQSYFLKLHTGVGWREIFKNLLQLRLPVVGAGNEYRAVRALRRVNVDTLSVAAYALLGVNPAKRQSVIVTDDLVDTVSLEEYCADWYRAPPPYAERMRLIIKLADSARRMHAAGINHRDFYLCHFHLDVGSLEQGPLRCFLIDLHRAQLRRRTPRRWRVKDLGGLYFSAMDCGLTPRDLLRFIRHYSDGGLRRAMEDDTELWRQVEARARQLHRKGLPGEDAAER